MTSEQGDPAAPEPERQGDPAARAVSGRPDRHWMRPQVSSGWWLAPVIAAAIVFTVLEPLIGGVAGCFAALLITAVVVIVMIVHEWAHGWMAMRWGMSVEKVVLIGWGGRTVFTGPFPRPQAKAAVAAVGPATTGLVAVLFLLGGAPIGAGAVRTVTLALGVVLASMAVINALPAPGLDGGAVVSSLVTASTGRESAGARAVARSGRIAGSLVAVAAISLVVSTPAVDTFVVVWPAVIVVMLCWSGTSSSMSMARYLDATTWLTWADLGMPAQAVGDDVVIRELSSNHVSVVMRHGEVVALVDAAAASRVPVDHWSFTPVSAVMTLVQPTAIVSAALTGRALAQALAVACRPAGFAIVVDAGGAPVRVVGRADVTALLQRRQSARH